MAKFEWSKPQHSKQHVNNAAIALLKKNVSQVELDDAYAVVNNFRSSHSYPLLVFRCSLSRRSAKIHPTAFVAQRLKRLETIKRKLTIKKTMRLTQMQDIGGCRAILQSASQAEALYKFYIENKKKHILHDFESAAFNQQVQHPRT